MKRWIAALLILSCLLSLMPLTAMASQQTKSKDGKLIALTFDDGPGIYTPRLLDGLKKRNVKVTFFVLGQNVKYYPGTVLRAFNEGHEINQHTYTHPTLTSKSNSQIRNELSRTDEAINKALGMELNYHLRPPYGDCNSRVLSVIERPAVMWSLDSIDWQLRNAQKVRDRIVAQAFDGAIILAHDIHSPTVDGTLMAIDILLERGYEFVTVSELYRRRGVTMEDGDYYYSCKPKGMDLGPISEPVINVEPTCSGFEVTMTADPGAKIYYSTDGSIPSTEYTGKLTLKPNEEIQAFACFEINHGRSETVGRTMPSVTLLPPTIRSENGKFYIENPNENGSVYYTVDGSLPTQDGILYVDAIAWYRGALTCCPMGGGQWGRPVTYYVSENGSVFLDVMPEEWYFDEMDWAACEGFLKGVEPYYFRPKTSLTRAMFVTMLYRLMEQQGHNMVAGTSGEFPDVNSGEWYEKAVDWSVSRGIVMGYEDGSFRPNRAISREEMCVILNRLLVALDYEVEVAEIHFEDGAEISPWAEEAVSCLAALEIIKGMEDNCFRPKNTATRAEAATVLHRLYNVIAE